jgi:hypothetical protein
MCYSNTGKVCFTPDPHYPAWSYSCPAEEADGTSLWHNYEMNRNYGHAIQLCQEHQESHPKVLKKLWSLGNRLDSHRHGGEFANDPENTGSESEQ